MTVKEKIKRLLDINAYKLIFNYVSDYKPAIFMLIFLNTSALLFETVLALISKAVVDQAMEGTFRAAFYYGLLFVAAFMTEIILMNITSYYTVHVTEKIRINLQQDLLSHIYRKNWLDISEYPTGDLLTRLYDDIQNVINSVTIIVPSIISLFIQLVAAFSILAYFDIGLALLAFTITPITIIIGMYIGQKTKVIQNKIQEATSDQRSLINESLQNQLILKAYNFLDYNLNQVHTLQDKRVSLIKERTMFRIKANTVMRMGSAFGFFFTLLFGAYRLSVKAITFGTFTAFIQLVEQIQSPIRRMSNQIPQLVASISSMERIRQVQDIEDEPQIPIKKSDVPLNIKIENLSFSYTESNPVLEHLSLEINKGDRVAIIGPSGKGKTTLVHILLGLIAPKKGQCTLTLPSGETVPLSPKTRPYFSYVPQTNTLFSGSIYQNFFLKKERSEDEINQALDAVCAREFVDVLPDGIHTSIHERGIDLSQGQGQRLTIARALLSDAPILLFDEATSALDQETERQLLENIFRLYPNKTLVAVTHREALLDYCSKTIHI